MTETLVQERSNDPDMSLCRGGSHDPDRATDFGIVMLWCRSCGREYAIGPESICHDCFGPLEPVYDYAAISSRVSRETIARGPRTLWRYEEFLPAPPTRIDLGAGFTPLRDAPRLAAELGLRKLWIKNDTLNPSLSFKDRAVSVALSAARYFGFTTVACASTGNLANSVAAHAAAAGLTSCVFIPKDLEAGKVAATGIYGGGLVQVEGSYDDANRLCTELSDRVPWAFVNTNLRSFYAEGAKTIGFEIAEQLGWRSPDAIVSPVASGCLLTKVDRAFTELRATGLLGPDEAPRVYGAQAAGCAPVATAYGRGTELIEPIKPATTARSLAIGNPADGSEAIRVARRTGGAIEAVPETSVAEGIALLARTEGLFAETAGGVVVSTLEQLVRNGSIHPSDETVVLITGQGLKTIEAVAGSFSTISSPPNVDKVLAALAVEAKE